MSIVVIVILGVVVVVVVHYYAFWAGYKMGLRDIEKECLGKGPSSSGRIPGCEPGGR